MSSPRVAYLAPFLLLACGAPRAVEAIDPPREPAPPSWSAVGASARGRPILARTRGHGPRRVYVIAGIHGDERPAVENARRLALLFDSDLPTGVAARLVLDANPDGTAARTRGNARGVDLNRNWPARNFEPARRHGPAPLSEPETAAVHADLVRFDPGLVIVLHAARRGPFVNFDGPAQAHAQAFAAAAAALDPRWRVVADVGYPTPGSLGSWLGIDAGVPILTVELPRSEEAEAVWPALRAGVLAALARAPAAAARPRD